MNNNTIHWYSNNQPLQPTGKEATFEIMLVSGYNGLTNSCMVHKGSRIIHLEVHHTKKGGGAGEWVCDISQDSTLQTWRFSYQPDQCPDIYKLQLKIRNTMLCHNHTISWTDHTHQCQQIHRAQELLVTHQPPNATTEPVPVPDCSSGKTDLSFSGSCYYHKSWNQHQAEVTKN